MTCWFICRLTFYRVPKSRGALFLVACVGWPISGRLFIREAYFRVAFSRVPLCLDVLFPGGFCRVVCFLGPYKII